MESKPSPEQPERLVGIDALRGLAMVLMALDHARDFWGDVRRVPENLETTTLTLFATRWVTHFCAPVFVFLAGTSAFLYGRRKSRGELARFLVSRGIWLVVLEFTVVHLAWFGSFSIGFFNSQVIAAIGVAMIVMGGLVWLPTVWVGALELLIVCGHNALDSIRPEDLGAFGTLWGALHIGNTWYPGWRLNIMYPFLPWIGVMAAGFAFGRVFEYPRGVRAKFLVRAGLVAVALFLLLRSLNVYGDLLPWERQDTPALSLVSFLNCTKYPPALLFLLMTLGPAFLCLAWFDRPSPGRLEYGLAIFGRVPLFYYVLHVALLNLSSMLYYRIWHEESLSMIQISFRAAPDWYGHGLGAVYLAWAVALLLLFPPCLWYAGVKRRSRSPLLSYL